MSLCMFGGLEVQESMALCTFSSLEHVESVQAWSPKSPSRPESSHANLSIDIFL